MDLTFERIKLQRLCESRRDLTKEYGADGAKKVMTRLAALRAAANLEEMRMVAGKCHELSGDRAGHLAVRLHDGHRLIFRPADVPPPSKSDGGLDWSLVTAIEILEIVDYH